MAFCNNIACNVYSKQFSVLYGNSFMEFSQMHEIPSSDSQTTGKVLSYMLGSNSHIRGQHSDDDSGFLYFQHNTMETLN